MDLSSKAAPLFRSCSQHLVPTCNPRSPRWREASLPGTCCSTSVISLPPVVGPGLEKAVVLALIFSVPVKYSPSWEKEPEGRMKSNMAVAVGAPVGWAVSPLLSGRYCDSGSHRLPVFKGAPGQKVLNILGTKGCSAEVTTKPVK